MDERRSEVRVFGDEKLPVAPLDRLGHHAHVLATRGARVAAHDRQRRRNTKLEP